MVPSAQYFAKVRALNDELRIRMERGHVLLTLGVVALPEEIKAAAIRIMSAYRRFTPQNDPYGEHDFGTFHHRGYDFVFQIVYYDPGLRFPSEDPSDPTKTKRAIYLMLAHEYC